MEISNTFWSPDITDCRCQQEETHSKYAVLSNVGRNIFSILPHGVGVEASFSLAWAVTGWRQSKSTCETLREKVGVRKFPWAKNGFLAGECPALDISEGENYLELKIAAEQRQLHRMALVHDFLEMWQGSQNLSATQKEFRAQNQQITGVWYISDTERSSKHPGQTFNMMVWLNSSCQKITLATSLVRKWPPCRMNSSIKPPPCQMNRAASSRNFRCWFTWKHCQHQTLA